jgi:hypothetical protein
VGGETFAIKLASDAAAERERGWYRGFATLRAGSAVCRFVDLELDPGALLFAIDPAATDAREFAVTRQRLPPRFGADVARRLAALHELAKHDAPSARDAPLARIASPNGWPSDAGASDAGPSNVRSSGAGDFAKESAIGGAGLRAACAQVQAALEPSAFVHGDVRWENAIVAGDADEAVLIDWEDAGRGAPAWDVGCLFASFAAYAVRAKALFGAALDSPALDAALRVQTAAAWEAYRAGSERARDPAFQRDTVRCAGVRLAETALAPSLTALSDAERIGLVDAASEMLRDPDGAALRWFGLDDDLA